MQGGAQSAASQGARLLWVEQVSIPDYLAGNGVVYQTTDVQYVIANNNLWASPLDQQLRTTLGANLSQQLPFNIVLRQEQDGYDAMVKTLAQAWSQEAAAIASELNRLP